MKPLLINLDLKNNSYEEIELKQGCQDTLIATITDLGEVCDLTGQVISVEMLKADNTFIIQYTDITVLNNKITIILNKDLTRVAGKGKLQLKMTKNGVISGSWVVDIKVRKGAIEGNIGESGNIVTIKEELDKSIVQAKVENDKTQELIQSGGAATKGEIKRIDASLAERTNESLNAESGWFLDKKTGFSEQYGTFRYTGANVGTTYMATITLPTNFTNKLTSFTPTMIRCETASGAGVVANITFKGYTIYSKGSVGVRFVTDTYVEGSVIITWIATGY